MRRRQGFRPALSRQSLAGFGQGASGNPPAPSFVVVSPWLSESRLGPWARQWSECSPRWLLSRPLVGAPTGILHHSLARPRRRGRAMRAWSRRAFPSQRLQRSRRADLGDRNGVGHGASTLTSAWPGQASQTALTERRCFRACSRSPTGNESNQGQRQRVSRSGA